jgi:hypothetical protein
MQGSTSALMEKGIRKSERRRSFVLRIGAEG